MSTGYSKHIQEDARLIILKELASQSDGRLNSSLLGQVLDAFGHARTDDWLRTQLHAMKELGAIELREIGSVLVAQITRAGVDHCLRRTKIEGIKQPSLGAV